jgi:HD-like signal output (HDOD) protein
VLSWLFTFFARLSGSPPPRPAQRFIAPAPPAPPAPATPPTAVALEPAAQRSSHQGAEQHAQRLAATFRCTAAEVTARAEASAQHPADWQQVQARLQNLKQIPALKSLARRFSHSMGREIISIPEVVGSISHDPALCLRLLQMANSVHVASEQPVSDLDTAVHMLGVDRVRLLSASMLLQRDSEGITSGFDWKHLWMHALATAMLADRLDEWMGRQAGNSLPACAILHDLGKIALSVVVPEVYQNVLLAAWQDRAALPPLEQARIGMDHREAGWIFGSEAGLPPVVLDTIAYHDSPWRAHPEHQGTVALVAVANQWAKIYGLGFSGDGSVIDVDIWETPAWEEWAKTLHSKPDIQIFASREPRWIEEIRRTLQSFHA